MLPRDYHFRSRTHRLYYYGGLRNIRPKQIFGRNVHFMQEARMKTDDIVQSHNFEKNDLEINKIFIYDKNGKIKNIIRNEPSDLDKNTI